MVERQVRAWYGRLLEGTFTKLASARIVVEPPGKDMEDWWRAINRLNEHLKAIRSTRIALTRSQFPRFYWKQPMGLEECPYSHRWVLDFGAFALRLHQWHSSDDARAFHDHPYWFLTLVLWGSYVDVSPAGRDLLTMGSVRFRPAEHQHTVEILKPGTWTLLVTGPAVRRWGFWVGGKLHKRDRYFATSGHHPCDPSGKPVRRKPDGTRL